MAYPEQLYAKIRAEYESGKYGSIEQLHENLRKKYDDFPSVDCLKVKCTSEQWERGKLKETIQEKYRQAFAARRFDENKVVELIEKLSEGVKTIVTKDGPVDVVDNAAIDDAITQYNKIVGGYAPVKTENVTPDKMKRFIIAVGNVVARFVPDDNKPDCIQEIDKLIEKFDNEAVWP